MALIGFKNTHNQDVFINPAQVLYIVAFEEAVSIIALAITSAGGKPHCVYVRGHLEFVRQRLESGQPYPNRARTLGDEHLTALAAPQPAEAVA
ncbi:hypothetical protein [Rhizobium sp. RU36D]|uniref:hypothetical protein n=1 Tax=Rhizobium sp. RU36D TaxID=1907415 RepID=UPI0009D8E042|nr:hypothetical protein [Rhizobium sp. RU36D]SMD14590.1 hypothetical protein SAMN05880593_12650 [Rhizobium sp. RU36D]